MSREVCGICWCPYDEETGACGCEPASKEQHMTNLREAAQQALEALEEATSYTSCTTWSPSMTEECAAAASALHAALAEPVQEPVAAWENKYGMKEWEVHALRAGWMPAPPQRKPLTDDEIAQVMYRADAIFTGPMQFRFARGIDSAHGIT